MSTCSINNTRYEYVHACVQVVSFRFLSSRFSFRFGSVRFGSARLGSVRFRSFGFVLVRFGSVRFGSVRFGSVRLSFSFEYIFASFRFESNRRIESRVSFRFARGTFPTSDCQYRHVPLQFATPRFRLVAPTTINTTINTVLLLYYYYYFYYYYYYGGP